MKEITINELRQMRDKEGLVLRGCGGDLKEGDYLIMDYSVQEGDTFEASILSDEEGIDGISAEM